MRVDLLVENAVNHNFLRIPESTFPRLQSTIQMQSSRYCTQTSTMTFFNIAETFVKITIF